LRPSRRRSTHGGRDVKACGAFGAKALLASLSAFILAQQAFASAPITLTPVAGGPAHAVTLESIKGRAHVALFWRSDCAPCLVELNEFAALNAAAQGGLVTIALEPTADARRTLVRFGVPLAQAYVVNGDVQTALEAVSDGGRRLPLAVALNADGQICARRIGLLGIEQAQAWVRQCSR